MTLTEEFKEMPTLLLASTLSGVALKPDGGVNVRSVCEVASWLLGFDIFTHEFVHPATMSDYRAAGFAQFPKLPDTAEAEADLHAAMKQALDAYGETVRVRKGTLERTQNPLGTAHDVMPHAQIIVVDPNG